MCNTPSYTILCEYFFTVVVGSVAEDAKVGCGTAIKLPKSLSRRWIVIGVKFFTWACRK